MQAIWSDTYYTYNPTSNPYFIFTIETDGGVIFYGKAWLKPNAEGITINLNNYCKDYLKTDMIDLLGVDRTVTYTHNDSTKTFVLKDENNRVLANYDFINDWSYEYRNYNNKPLSLSKPINGNSIDGMLMFYSYLDVNNKVKTVISPSITDINDSARSTLYKDKGLCGPRYALYYSNRYGGWDSFLIEGKGIRNDSYQNYFTANNYNNNTIQFGKKVYHNVITTRYELHTGWLNDSQSENLAFNLLSSNNVYLQDLKEGTIMPVLISNTDTNYKTFKNNNKQLVNYTIQVECSHKQHNL